MWAWALEWNASLRLIGFVGDPEAMQAAADQLPSLTKHVIERTPKSTTRYREEQALPPKDDRLFRPPDGC